MIQSLQHNKDKEMRKKHNVISLFSGAMGLDIGLEKAGFNIVVCNEIDKAAISTIEENRPKLPVLKQSIEDINLEKLSSAAGFDVKNIPLMSGGPPCQSFSVYGNRQGIKDTRGKLIFEYTRLVEEVQPKFFIMENVRGLHSMPVVPKSYANSENEIPPEYFEKGSLLKDIIARFESIGYRLDCFLVNVVNYGAPQIRERLLCIGNRYNIKVNFPQPKYSNRPKDHLPPFKTLGEAIGNGFIDPDPALMNFSPRKLHYLSMVPSGGNWRSLPEDIQKESMGKSWYLKGGRSATWRKLSYDFPSPTVVTMPNHASTSMCHPTELRALTVGECATIQEFPKNWKFNGTPAQRYRQIGNAVPPRLGLVAGEVIIERLNKLHSKNENITKTKEMSPSNIEHIRSHVRTKSFWRNGKALAGNYSYYDFKDKQYNLPLFDKEDKKTRKIN
jgi:DNA (cytosine-5)-methyltransferase 1